MLRKRQSLDSYDQLPADMRNYLRHYGRHFNRKMYEFAFTLMYGEDDDEETKKRTPTKDEFNALMNKYGITLENDVMYDGVYVMVMAMSDFLGRSIPDEEHLALYVKDYIDDPDQADGFVFNRFYADCVLKGEPIDWYKML